MPDDIPVITVALDPPSGWVDKTMIIHSAPTEPGRAMAPNTVVGRDALGEGETFASFCDRQKTVFADGLPQYHLKGERQGLLHGLLPATQLLFAWTSGAGELTQQASFIDVGNGVVVTFTASAAAADFAAHQDLFNEQLAKLRIETAPAAVPKP